MRRSCGFALVLTALALAAPPSHAVPMWTRRYGVPCAMCHAYPSLQLTDAGLDFLRRGHRMTGDTFDKDVFHLISAHVEGQYAGQQGQANPFTTPEFHLHAGGALAPMFSAYVDGGVGSAAELETARFQFTAEHGAETYFIARAGKFIPTLIRNYGSGLMASASTPLILTDATLGNNPFTPARPGFGIDVAGRVKWFFVQSGVVNGEDVEGQAAVGNHKDVYATVEFALPDGISGLGLYYHSGGYDLDDPTAGTLFDRYDREGVFANVTRDEFRIAGAYIKGTDHVDTRADQKIDGYYIQTDVHPVDWVVPFIRYDDVKTTDDVAETRTRKGTLGTAFRLFENEITAGRIVLEVSRTKDQDVSSNGALAALLWAF